MARIVIAAMGSRGDVLPFLALGRGLVARGHAVRIATPGNHANLVTDHGFRHIHMRPDPTRAMQAEREAGLTPEIGDIMARVIAPGIRDGHADLLAACGKGACDLMIGGFVPIAPMAAETLGIPFAPAALQPIAFFSGFDPPVPAEAAWLAPLARLGPLYGLPQRAVARAVMRRWARPFAAARRGFGLPPARDPLLNFAAPPPFALALFSAQLAKAQRDWPAGARPTGFCRLPGGAAPAEVAAFLDAGPPPLVVSLGSSMVRLRDRVTALHAAATEAAGRLGLRVLLLAGSEENRRALAARLPPDCLAVASAPHDAVFPRAGLILHHGGAGTAAEAMRAGVPMLVVPIAGDQFDNAARLERAGVARMLLRSPGTARIAAALAALDRPEPRARARAMSAAMAAEDGVAGAVAVIEAWLARASR